MLKLNKKNKYVLACSFGPDSMALFNMCLKEGLDLVVAHVNYHHRKEADFEQKSLEKFCKTHKIPCEVLSTNDSEIEGNFEAWAREKRYKFFAEVCKKYSTNFVLVGHNQDDVIETYLMQKNRGKFAKNSGIAAEIDNYGVHIIRPLIDVPKKELQKYCDKNKVPYSIDSTNLEDKHERNRIRHHVVGEMTEEQRTEILKEIKNIKKPAVLHKNMWDLKEFLVLQYEQIVTLIDGFMSKTNCHRNLSKGFVAELKKAAKGKKPNLEIKITDELLFEKVNDKILFVDAEKLGNYELKLEKLGKLTTDFLDIDFSKGGDDRNIGKNDFPLTIRNLKPTDKIEIEGHLVKASRAFINWKMPLYVRNIWPGVFNKDNKLLYAPRYREEFVDNHKSKFEIKLWPHFGAK